MQKQLDDKSQKLATFDKARASEEASDKAQKAQLTDLQNQNGALKKQVTALTASQISQSLELAAAKTLDSQTVSQLKKQLAESQNHAVGLTNQITDLKAKAAANEKAAEARSNDEKAVAALKQSLSQSQREAETLKKSLSESQNLAKDLQAKNTALIAEDKHKAEQIAASQLSLAENKKQHDALNKSWQDASGKVKEQEKQLTELRNQKPATAETPVPNSQNEMRSYALGTLWGHEVNGAMEKVKSDGITLELSQVISGVSDTLNSKFRISEKKIMEQLDAMNKQALAKSKPVENRGSDKFLQSFSKKPGTKQDEMGYYYRILNKGEGKITASNVVAISVKESLANGKVIKDMTKTGKALSLPLTDFPPLFSTAISKMNNKGKLIMAVPPELAYGEQGRPPEIPPNSTMVYEITVVDVRPAAGK